MSIDWRLVVTGIWRHPITGKITNEIKKPNKILVGTGTWLTPKTGQETIKADILISTRKKAKISISEN